MKWWDKSWSPVTGCTPISEGCKNCWAKRMTDRNLWGYDFTPRFHPERLNIPRKWKKPRRIFVCSMGDLFHEDVPNRWVDRIGEVIQVCPQHTFMVLTKRPDRMREYFKREGACFPMPNVWLGVTAENQARADERIPILLDTPAAHGFVSIEPMLGPVDLHVQHNQGVGELLIDGLDWVILGGETGPGNRHMYGDWARSIRDQCKEVGVPFFMKQMNNQRQIPDDLMIREIP